MEAEPGGGEGAGESLSFDASSSGNDYLFSVHNELSSDIAPDMRGQVYEGPIDISREVAQEAYTSRHGIKFSADLRMELSADVLASLGDSSSDGRKQTDDSMVDLASERADMDFISEISSLNLRRDPGNPEGPNSFVINLERGHDESNRGSYTPANSCGANGSPHRPPLHSRLPDPLMHSAYDEDEFTTSPSSLALQNVTNAPAKSPTVDVLAATMTFPLASIHSDFTGEAVSPCHDSSLASSVSSDAGLSASSPPPGCSPTSDATAIGNHVTGAELKLTTAQSGGIATDLISVPFQDGSLLLGITTADGLVPNAFGSDLPDAFPRIDTLRCEISSSALESASMTFDSLHSAAIRSHVPQAAQMYGKSPLVEPGRFSSLSNYSLGRCPAPVMNKPLSLTFEPRPPDSGETSGVAYEQGCTMDTEAVPEPTACGHNYVQNQDEQKILVDSAGSASPREPPLRLAPGVSSVDIGSSFNELPVVPLISAPQSGSDPTGFVAPSPVNAHTSVAAVPHPSSPIHPRVSDAAPASFSPIATPPKAGLDEVDPSCVPSVSFGSRFWDVPTTSGPSISSVPSLSAYFDGSRSPFRGRKSARKKKLAETDVDLKEIQGKDLSELEKLEDVVELESMLEAQKKMVQWQIDELQRLMILQCQLTGKNPLSEDVVWEVLGMKGGGRRSEVPSPEALKCLQEVFAIKDTITKKEARDISVFSGATLSQVRECFAAQRSQVRKLVQLAYDEVGRQGIKNASEQSQQTSAVSNSIRGMEKDLGFQKLTSAESMERLLDLMRAERSFAGQTQLLQIILQTDASVMMLRRFLEKGGLKVLGGWLVEAAAEEQTSVVRHLLKAFAHLPISHAVPHQMPSLVQNVNKLRFYRIADVGGQARSLLAKWSKMLKQKSDGVKSASVPSSKLVPEDPMSSGGPKRNRDTVPVVQGAPGPRKKKIKAVERLNQEDKTPTMTTPVSPVLNGLTPGMPENSSLSQPSVPTPLPSKQRWSSTLQPSESAVAAVSVSRKRLADHSKERRKVLLVEDKPAGKSPLGGGSKPVTASKNSRPLSTDDIYKAKKLQRLMQEPVTKSKRRSAPGQDSTQAEDVVPLAVSLKKTVSPARPELADVPKKGSDHSPSSGYTLGNRQTSTSSAEYTVGNRQTLAALLNQHRPNEWKGQTLRVGSEEQVEFQRTMTPISSQDLSKGTISPTLSQDISQKMIISTSPEEFSHRVIPTSSQNPTQMFITTPSSEENLPPRDMDCSPQEVHKMSEQDAVAFTEVSPLEDSQDLPETRSQLGNPHLHMELTATSNGVQIHELVVSKSSDAGISVQEVSRRESAENLLEGKVDTTATLENPWYPPVENVQLIGLHEHVTEAGLEDKAEVTVLTDVVKDTTGNFANEESIRKQEFVQELEEHPPPKETQLVDFYAALRASMVRWRIPPEYQPDPQWNVAAGEDSKEKEVQSARVKREEEAYYPDAYTIPGDPKDPWEEEPNYDDSLTFEIFLDNNQRKVVPGKPSQPDPIKVSNMNVMPSEVPSNNVGTGNGYCGQDSPSDVSSKGSNAKGLELVLQQLSANNGATHDPALLALLLQNPDLVTQLTLQHGLATSGRTNQNVLAQPMDPLKQTNNNGNMGVGTRTTTGDLGQDRLGAANNLIPPQPGRPVPSVDQVPPELQRGEDSVTKHAHAGIGQQQPMGFISQAGVDNRFPTPPQIPPLVGRSIQDTSGWEQPRLPPPPPLPPLPPMQSGGIQILQPSLQLQGSKVTNWPEPPQSWTSVGAVVGRPPANAPQIHSGPEQLHMRPQTIMTHNVRPHNYVGMVGLSQVELGAVTCVVPQQEMHNVSQRPWSNGSHLVIAPSVNENAMLHAGQDSGLGRNNRWPRPPGPPPDAQMRPIGREFSDFGGSRQGNLVENVPVWVPNERLRPVPPPFQGGYRPPPPPPPHWQQAPERSARPGASTAAPQFPHGRDLRQPQQPWHQNIGPPRPPMWRGP